MGEILAKYGIPVEILTDWLHDRSEWLDHKIITEFVKKFGVACGGNWAAMYISAIRHGAPELMEELDRFPDDHLFNVCELESLLAAHLKVKAFEAYAEFVLEVTLPEYQKPPEPCLLK